MLGVHVYITCECKGIRVEKANNRIRLGHICDKTTSFM